MNLDSKMAKEYFYFAAEAHRLRFLLTATSMKRLLKRINCVTG